MITSKLYHNLQITNSVFFKKTNSVFSRSQANFCAGQSIGLRCVSLPSDKVHGENTSVSLFANPQKKTLQRLEFCPKSACECQGDVCRVSSHCNCLFPFLFSLIGLVSYSIWTLNLCFSLPQPTVFKPIKPDSNIVIVTLFLKYLYKVCVSINKTHISCIFVKSFLINITVYMPCINPKAILNTDRCKDPPAPPRMIRESKACHGDRLTTFQLAERVSKDFYTLHLVLPQKADARDPVPNRDTYRPPTVIRPMLSTVQN